VGLVRTWTGQLARAAGATLIAPIVLLLALSVVASGGGLGSVGSLREIASGPSLPDIGLASTPGAALENAEIVGAELPPPAEVSRPPVPAPEALASATPPVRAQAPGGSTVVAPHVRAETPPPQRFKLKGPSKPERQIPKVPAPPTPPAPATPAPVEDIIDATRGIGEALRQPLQPLTDAILNLLNGPPRP
jgi:hypothetical protein